MAKYDDASWHHGGDFPADLPQENGATHIGMFLAWCINNDLVSEYCIEDFAEEVEQVKNRQLTGADFLIDLCDEKFTDEDLNELGNQFATDYYDYDDKKPTKFAKAHANYLDDYAKLLNNGSLENDIYRIENSWENYDLLKPTLDQRFTEWKKFKANK